jgi:hypothetical protein
MKIKIKLPKPRNPLVVPVKNKRGGAHGSYKPERHARRVAKHALYLCCRDEKLMARLMCDDVFKEIIPEA